jgi:predicted ArsR family transcriptional regulator
VSGGGDGLLSQSTRRRLFALFAVLGASATTELVVARVAMYPNGVRTQLARMEAAGLLVRRRVPQPRGRPRDEWAVSPTAPATGDDPQAYRALAPAHDPRHAASAARRRAHRPRDRA